MSARKTVKLPEISPSSRKREGKTGYLAERPPNCILSSSLEVRRDIKLICTWYKSWRSWQRHILLYSLASSCSNDQLNILLTSLEALHHHDFSALLAPQAEKLNKNSPTHKSLKKYKDAFLGSTSVKGSVSDSYIPPEVRMNLDHPAFLPQVHSALSNASLYNPESEDFFSFQRKGFGASLTLEYSSCLLAPGQHRKKPRLRSKTWTGAVKPNSHQLVEQFKSQQSTISQWLQTWDGHQKSWLLLEIVKLSNSEQLGYLAQCIHHRLVESVGVDLLEDHLLMNIFSYLDPATLCTAGQVCRRWRRLAGSDVLWKEHCGRLSRAEEVEGLTEALEALGQDQHHLDWRQAYSQLRTLVKRVKILVLKSAEAAVAQLKASRLLEETQTIARMPSAVFKGNLSLREMVKMVRGMSADPRSPYHHILAVAPESAIRRRRRLRSMVPSSLSVAEERGSLAGPDQQEGPLLLLLPGKENRPQKSPLLTVRQDFSAPSQSHMVGLPDLSVVPTGMAVKGVMPRPVLSSTIEQLQQEVKGEDKNSVYHRNRKLATLVPVAVDTRPFVPYTPDPAGVQALVLSGLLMEGSAHRPGKPLPLVKVKRIAAHDGSITCARFDVRKIVSGSMDMTVRVHDMRSGREVCVLGGHKGGVRCLQYDETVLVTGSWDTSCVVWDLVQGCVLTELLAHQDAVSCLDLSSTYIVSGSRDSTVCVWHRTTYHCVHHLKGHKGPVRCVLLSEGRVFSGGSDGRVLRWSLESGEQQGQLTHPAAVLAMELSGLLLVTATAAGQVHCWSLASQETLMTWSIHSTGAEPSTAITAITLYMAHLLVGASDGCLYECDLSTGTCVRFLRGHSLPITSIQGGEHRFVTASSDMTICVWHTKEADKGGRPYFMSGEDNFFSHLPIKVVTL